MPYPLLTLLAAMLSVMPPAAAAVRLEHERGPRRAQSGAPAPVRADSSRVHRDARAAQSRFERVRRRHLPRSPQSFGGSCVEIIGRYCFSGGGDEPDWIPPPEHPAVTAARDTLLAALEAAQFALPGDGWITGQRVRYLLEAGRTEDALRAAGECAADRWWCHALSGLVHHETGGYAAAEAAFGSALAGMPASQREVWSDLSLLLSGAEARRYARMTGAARAEARARFWWLADPFYLVPGNDRLTEHYARHTHHLVQEQARQLEGHRWAWDHREILLRFGWPLGWQLSTPATLAGSPTVVSHYPNVAPHFLPPLESAALAEALPRDAWPIDAARPRSWYSARYAPRPGTLEHQLARFRRGDSVLVVAVVGPPHDTVLTDSLLRAEAVEVGLFVAAGPDGPVRRATRAMQARRVVLTALVPADPMLVSVEWLHRGARQGGRSRYGLDRVPAHEGGTYVSDLLVLEDVDSLPTSLAAALEVARASVRLGAGERIGLLWEVNGPVARTERIVTGLALSGGEPGALRRLAERARLVRRRGSVALQWEDVLTGPGPHARSLALELPHRRPGVYELELTVARPGRPPVSITRRIEVVP